MLLIDKWAGQMGNQILHYNNLVQLSHLFKKQSVSIPFSNSDIFVLENLSTSFNGLKIDEVLTADRLIRDDFVIEDGKNYLLDVCLHELFFKFNAISTFDVFKFKNDLPSEDKKNITIHFRGGDYKIWDSKSQLDTNYYINSIDFIENEINEEHIFNVLTDDYTLNSYQETIRYLKSKNKKIKLGDKNLPINDFITISNSDYIISSPSTFCVTAAFCGKRDKKIIHSDKWMQYKLESDYFRDIFWKNLNDGGNNDYKLWKKI